MIEYISNNPIICCMIIIEILLIIDWIRVEIIPEWNYGFITFIAIFANISGIIISYSVFTQMIKNPGLNLLASIPAGSLIGFAIGGIRTLIVYLQIEINSKFFHKPTYYHKKDSSKKHQLQ